MTQQKYLRQRMDLEHLINLNGEVSPTGSSNALISGNIIKAASKLFYFDHVTMCYGMFVLFFMW